MVTCVGHSHELGPPYSSVYTALMSSQAYEKSPQGVDKNGNGNSTIKNT